MKWTLEPGDRILRTHLHDQYGGNRQGGIAPSRKSPNIFIFSDPAHGEEHGYDDHWEGEIFHYAGHGQVGDQDLAAGNRTILDHESEGRVLRVFDGVSGEVTYLGEFELDHPEYYWTTGPGRDGRQRKIVMFRLRRSR